jgi:hypothetical protein
MKAEGDGVPEVALYEREELCSLVLKQTAEAADAAVMVGFGVAVISTALLLKEAHEVAELIPIA